MHSAVVLSLHTSCLRSLWRLLRLLCDGAIVLWLVLSQRRVCLAEHDWSTLQGQFQQEPPGRHQVTIALWVGEGVARPTGADTLTYCGACLRTWQRLLSYLIPHLEEGERNVQSWSLSCGSINVSTCLFRTVYCYRTDSHASIFYLNSKTNIVECMRYKKFNHTL